MVVALVGYPGNRERSEVSYPLDPEGAVDSNP